MNRRRARMGLPALGILALAALAGGCGGATDFKAPHSLSEGIAGKSWRSPAYLEVSSDNPAVNGENRSANGFDVAAIGEKIFLAAALYDSSAAKFVGYGRLYQEPTGWAAAGGSDFVAVAAGTGSIGHVTLATNHLHTIALGTFFEDSSNGAITALNSGSWSPAVGKTGLAGRPGFAATENLAYAPAVTSAFDKLGKAFSFFNANLLGTPTIYMEYWEAATAYNLAGEFSYTPSSESGSAIRNVTARFDGSRRVCVLNESSATGGQRKLYGRCMDTIGAAPGTPSFSPASTSESSPISSDVVQGHDLASDGAGRVMAVFYQKSSGSWAVMANRASAGLWETTPKQISVGMADGYVAAPATSGASLRPGVVHIGKGFFLAAWVGVNPSSKTARMYSALYDPSAGWSAPEAFGEEAAYSQRLPFESFHLFTNLDGNAGIAIRTIDQEGSSVNDDKRGLLVGRYHFDSGWLDLEKKGNGCKPTGASVLAACTHRPLGAILPSGTTVVVFQDQDSSGRYRLAGVEFR